MRRVEIVLLNGFNDPEGNRLRERFEKHTGGTWNPHPGEGSFVYHVLANTFEDASEFVENVFEQELKEAGWREHLRLRDAGGID